MIGRSGPPLLRFIHLVPEWGERKIGKIGHLFTLLFVSPVFYFYPPARGGIPLAEALQRVFLSSCNRCARCLSCVHIRVRHDDQSWWDVGVVVMVHIVVGRQTWWDVGGLLALAFWGDVLSSVLPPLREDILPKGRRKKAKRLRI